MDTKIALTFLQDGDREARAIGATLQKLGARSENYAGKVLLNAPPWSAAAWRRFVIEERDRVAKRRQAAALQGGAFN